MTKQFEHWSDIDTPERIERVDQLLRVLTGMSTHARRRHFDMRQWGKKTPCGSVGCAGGQAGLDPWFRRRGLRLVVLSPPDPEVDDETEMGFPGMEPDYVFGDQLYYGVFTNDKFLESQAEPQTLHKIVVGAIRAFRATLKAEAAAEKARELFEELTAE